MKTCHVSLVCLLLGFGVAAASPAPRATDDPDVVFSIEKFATNLYQKIIKQHPGNEVHSPLGMNFALAKIHFGAAGKTRTEVHEVLKLGQSYYDNTYGYPAVVKKFEKVPNVAFNLSSKIYVAKNIDIKEKYRAMIKNVSKAEIEAVDFRKPNTKFIIDIWAQNKTHGLVSKIIDDGDITPETKVIFLSLVYFKGDWKAKFSPCWGTRPFRTPKMVSAETMQVIDTFRTGNVKGVRAKFIMFPFKNTDFNFIVFLPDDVDGFDCVKKGIEKVDFAYMLNDGSDKKLQVYLPKFKIEKKIHAKSILHEMGVKEAFTSRADFSLITNDLFHITKFLHKTVIDVNVTGINAGSGSVGPGISPPVVLDSMPHSTFDINRSFIAKLVHITRNTGAVEKVITLVAVDVRDPTKN